MEEHSPSYIPATQPLFSIFHNRPRRATARWQPIPAGLELKGFLLLPPNYAHLIRIFRLTRSLFNRQEERQALRLMCQIATWCGCPLSNRAVVRP
jgi:hypothetical protein